MTTNRESLSGFVVDTNVISYIVKRTERDDIDYHFYASEISSAAIHVPEVVLDELEKFEWMPEEHTVLVELMSSFIRLPPLAQGPPSRATVEVVRRKLQLEQLVDDNDVEIITHAAQQELGFMSHDRRALRVANGMGIAVVTQHDDLDLVFAGDERRLVGWRA